MAIKIEPSSVLFKLFQFSSYYYLPMISPIVPYIVLTVTYGIGHPIGKSYVKP